MPSASVQIETVARLERDLNAAKARAADAIRTLRANRGVSLRTVADAVDLSQTAIHELEHGRSWSTSTARKVFQFLRDQATANAA